MNNKKICLFNVLFCILLTLCALCVAFPFLYAMSKSFMGWDDIILWSPGYLKAYINSLGVASAITILNLLIAVPAAYIFRILKWKYKNILYFLYVVLLLMPYQATMLPEYIISKQLGIYDTLFAVILPSVFSPLSFVIISQIFRAVPDEILEACRLETSSQIKIVIKIAIPTVKNGIIFCAALSFTEAWNMLERPYCLIESEKTKLLQQFISDMDQGAPLFAAVTLSAIIPLLIFIFAEESLRDVIIKT